MSASSALRAGGQQALYIYELLLKQATPEHFASPTKSHGFVASKPRTTSSSLAGSPGLFSRRSQVASIIQPLCSEKRRKRSTAHATVLRYSAPGRCHRHCTSNEVLSLSPAKASGVVSPATRRSGPPHRLQTRKLKSWTRRAPQDLPRCHGSRSSRSA